MDGSTQVALSHGADVIELNMNVPFTAARARNAGFRRLREVAPDLRYVQFVDGDCELIDWMGRPGTFLSGIHADVGSSAAGCASDFLNDRFIIGFVIGNGTGPQAK